MDGSVVETSSASGEAPVVAPSASIRTLAITSLPDNAEIYIDGNFLGNTPATLKLPAAAHTILLKLRGFPDFSRTLELPKSSKRSPKADFTTVEPAT